MSVLIKGMEMPTRCEDCPMGFSVNFGILCTPTHNIVGDGEISKKQNWCPLVPVPPHGRLIDADALVEILLKVIDINASIEQRNEATEQERRCLWWFEQQIGIAPTIIPAEEGEA